MADLATLGITVIYTDTANASKKLDEIAASAKKTEAQVDRLTKSTKRASDSISKETSSATKNASKGYAELRGEINKLASAFPKLNGSTRALKDLQLNLNQVSAAARQAYASGKLSTEGYLRLTTATDGLTKNIKEQTKVLNTQKNEMSSFGEVLSGVGRRIKQFGQFMIAAFALQAVIGGIKSIIGTVIEFDQSLKSLQAIAGATAREAIVMGESIKGIARDTKFSAQEVAAGMELIGKAGFTASEALKMIQDVSNLATGTLEDFSKVASLVVTAVRAFGLEVVETGRITDVFANGITKSKLSVDGLATAFGYVGAAGAQAGLSLEEVTGSLMVLADNGIRASTMGTALRKMLLSLVGPNESLKNAIMQVGLSMDDINPAIVGWENVLKNIAPLVWDFRTNTVDMAKAVEFFGIRASQVAAILIRETAQGGGLVRAIESTKELGAALRMAEKQQEGLGVKFKNVADQAKNVALAIGEAGLTGVLHTLADALKVVTIGVEDFVKAYPAIAQFTGYVAVFGAIATAIGVIGATIGFVMPAITAFWVALTGPIGLIVAGLAAVVTSFSYLNNRVQDNINTLKEQSIVIDETVSTMEGWIIVLEKAAKEGIEAYNAALVRFAYENKEITKEILNLINTHDMLDGQIAHSMDQVIAISGSFENYVVVVKKAMEAFNFEKSLESLDKFSEAFESKITSMKEIETTSGILELQMYGPFTDKNIQETQVKAEELKRNIKVDLDEIREFINDFSRKVVDTAEKSGDTNAFVEKYTEKFKEIPEVYDAIMTEINAIIENRSKVISNSIEKYSNMVNDRLSSHYKSMYDNLKEFRDNINKIQSYIDKNTLSTYALEKKEAKKTYDELIVLAGNNTELKEQLEVAYQSVLSDLWNKEVIRRKKINDDIIKDKELQVKELIALEVSLMKNKEAINLTDKERRMLVDKETVAATKKILEERASLKEKALKEEEEAEKKALEKQQKDYEEMLTNIQDFTADVFLDIFQGNIDGWEDMADRMKDIFFKMLAELAAKALMNTIVIPMVGSFTGGASGYANMGGSLLGGNGTGGFNFPGSSVLNWTQNNVPGMGWLGSSIPGTSGAFALGTGTQGMLYPGGISGAVPGGFGGGVSWGSALGAGALGGMGYSMIGGALGLPQSEYSGLTAGLGAAGMSAYGGSLASMTGISALGGPIGIAAGAILGGVIGGLFGGDDPKHMTGIFATGSLGTPHGDMSAASDEYMYGTVFRNTDPSQQNSLISYFDSRFDVLQEATTGNINDIMKQAGDWGWAGYKEIEGYENDPQGLLNAIETGVFSHLVDSLVADLDAALVDVTDFQFFKDIQADGEALFNTFARFSIVVQETDNFTTKLTSQMEEYGLTIEEAFNNLVVINDILKVADSVIESIVTTGTTTALEGITKNWETLLETLKKANGTVEDITKAELARNAALGVTISGLNANSLQSILMSGGDIETVKDTLGQGIATIISATFAEQMAEEFFKPLNIALGDAQANGKSLTDVMNQFKWDDLAEAMAKAQVEVDRITGSFGAVLGAGGPDAGGDERVENIKKMQDDAVSARSQYVDSLQDALKEAQKEQDILYNNMIDAENNLASVREEYAKAEIKLQQDQLTKTKNQYSEISQNSANTLNDLQRTLDSITDYQKGLLTGSYSYLMPDEKLAQAKIDFAEASPEDLPKMAQILLESAKGALTDPNQYKAIFESVQGRLSGAAGSISEEMKLLQQQSDYAGAQLIILEAELETLTQSQSTLMSLEDADKAYREAKTAFEESKWNDEINYYEKELERLNEITNATLSVKQALDQYQYALMRAIQSGYDQLYNQFFSELQDLKANAPSFASGGISTGPTSGYSATLHGTEAIIPLNGGDSIPVVVQNNDEELKNLIRILIAEVQQGKTTSTKMLRILDRATEGENGFLVREEV